MNDEELELIKNLSKNINTETIILFWHFTIKFLNELEIVQLKYLYRNVFNRLIHIKSFKSDNLKLKIDTNIENKMERADLNKNKDVIKQMRNIAQEEEINSPKINVNKDKKEPRLSILMI